MGLFDSLKGAAGGGLMDALGDGQVLMQIIAKLREGGLDDVVSSWIGNGANAGIEPSQLTDILGQGAVAEFASKLGLSGGDPAQLLSQFLPTAVDGISPEGELPPALTGMLGGFLRR